MGKGKQYSANDYRSMSMNNQNSSGQAATANHNAQLTPGTPAYNSSRGIGKSSDK